MNAPNKTTFQTDPHPYERVPVLPHEVPMEAVNTKRRPVDFSQKGALADSERLLGNSRALVHSLLNANEQERLILGTRLRDEVLQMLIGIHIRLIALNHEISLNGKAMNKEFILTENLMRKSQITIDSLKKSMEASSDL